MIVRNETEIQLLKILFKNNGKATKNLVSKNAYPHGIEQKFYRKLKAIFKPLTDYVNKYLDENMNALLHGDSDKINLDAIPGRTFRNMIANLENWISIYMPDIKDSQSKNKIYLSLDETADEAKEFGEKEFEKMLKKGINVELPLSSDWWQDMKNSWSEDNYTLITSNAKNYVSKINTLTEQAVVNGLSSKQLMEDIKKATEGLSDKHCRLLARDQIGKLNGQITQAQMQEIGLNMYVWDTSGDERVRPSHILMDGLLCRWDDASLCSYDNGKTWEKRPSGAVELHPGQDIQCRCIALSYYPELVSEIENVGMSEIVSNSPPVQDLPQFSNNDVNKYPEYIRNNIDELKKEFNYVGIPEKSFTDRFFDLVESGGINPKFKFGTKTGNNCQRCVPALQMKMKGFDIEALPLPKNHPISDMSNGENWYSWLKDKNGNIAIPMNIWSQYSLKLDGSKPIGEINITSDDIRNYTVDLIQNAPEGSMFELKCNWKNGNGHVFSAFSGGKKGVIFYDPQNNDYGNSMFNLYLDSMELSSLEIIRTDDKIMDVSRIKESCKNKEKEKK